MNELKLYTELAEWWHLLSAPEDYAEEATFYRKAMCDAAQIKLKTVLELGSGGGNNASHMKACFTMTLVDMAPNMLKVSESLNPECEHIEGDMRTVRLNRTFDAIFVHDAICYMTTAADLQAVVETAWTHCNPGGVVLFAPDHTSENFEESSDEGGHNDGARGIRYLQWTWDPHPEDNSYIFEMAYMVRESNGKVHVEHDRHLCGLFSRELWLKLMHDAGFDAKLIPFEHSEVDTGPLDVFVGRKPA